MEILEVEPIYTAQWWTYIVLLILECTTAVFWGIAFSDRGKTAIIVAAIFTCLIVAWVVMLINGFTAYHIYDKLVVRISNEVTVNELYSKYEIESKEKYSNIYKIRQYPQ